MIALDTVYKSRSATKVTSRPTKSAIRLCMLVAVQSWLFTVTMRSPGRSAHDGKSVRENDLPAPTDDKVGECDRPTI